MHIIPLLKAGGSFDGVPCFAFFPSYVGVITCIVASLPVEESLMIGEGIWTGASPVTPINVGVSLLVGLVDAPRLSFRIDRGYFIYRTIPYGYLISIEALLKSTSTPQSTAV